MKVEENATLLRDVIMDAARSYVDMTGDGSSFAVVVCASRDDGADDEREFVNMATTCSDVTITEAISVVLRAIEKMLPEDMRLQLVAGAPPRGEG